MIEDEVENEHVEEEGILLCCISFHIRPQAKNLNHLMIFEISSGNSKLYTVKNFADQLQAISQS